MIRAMANTLCDWEIDCLNPSMTTIVLTLHRAGFFIQEIETNVDDAIMMAAIRQRNDRIKSYEET